MTRPSPPGPTIPSCWKHGPGSISAAGTSGRPIPTPSASWRWEDPSDSLQERTALDDRVFDRDDLFQQLLDQAGSPLNAVAWHVERANSRAYRRDWPGAAARSSRGRGDRAALAHARRSGWSDTSTPPAARPRRGRPSPISIHGSAPTWIPSWPATSRKSTLMLPDPGVSLDQVRPLVERALAYPGRDRGPSLLTEGLWLYRQGRYEEAVRILDQAKAEPGESARGIEAPLALAHHRLGRTDDARRLAQSIERNGPAPGTPIPSAARPPARSSMTPRFPRSRSRPEREWRWNRKLE